MGLAITGIVVRRLANVDLGQRHGIEPDQFNVILDDSSKQALRELLQTVEQQAVHGKLETSAISATMCRPPHAPSESVRSYFAAISRAS